MHYNAPLLPHPTPFNSQKWAIPTGEFSMNNGLFLVNVNLNQENHSLKYIPLTNQLYAHTTCRHTEWTFASTLNWLTSLPFLEVSVVLRMEFWWPRPRWELSDIGPISWRWIFRGQGLPGPVPWGWVSSLCINNLIYFNVDAPGG